MKYFGTDGVRGRVSNFLTVDLALEIGKSAGAVIFKNFQENELTDSANRNPLIIVGKDTRQTSDMLENALIAGLVSRGVDVLQLGVIPTPAVAYITRQMGAQAGVVISASHNPYHDNGIKFFGHDGFKLRDNLENEIEDVLNYPEQIWNYPLPEEDKIGTVIENAEATQKYLQYLRHTVDTEFEGMHIAIDCSNGSTSFIAPKLFTLLGAKISVMGNTPNGTNINAEVGSTHPEALSSFVLETGADIGFAFDGDGDRVIAVDDKGEVRDGDYILFLIGNYLKEKHQLKNNTIVSTIMANLGFHQGLEELGINTIQTDVGDRFVAQAMLQGGYILGGEQSGHIVFLEHSTTGDGLLSALQLLQVVKKSNLPLSKLSKMMTKLPQILVNLKVNDKDQILQNPKLREKELEISERLGKTGRVLLRPSGTEPLIRVMVEAETEDMCHEIAHEIVSVISSILNR